MNLKQFKICRLVIMIILSASIILSINLANYYLPIIFIMSAMAELYYCKKQLKTKEVLVDERDYEVAGKAARYTISLYGIFGAIGTFVLMALSQKEGIYYILSQYLALSVCFLLIFNALFFKYLSKKNK